MDEQNGSAIAIVLRSTATPLKRLGGARRDRTDDLMLAKHALSQLSYGPGPAREYALGIGGPGKT